MLKIQDLHVHYGAIHALKGISLEVGQGEIVTIIGANGAGKSTLLRAISGLIKRSSGSINYSGQEISKTPSHQIVRRGLIHVPEGRRIFTQMTVYENLLLGAFARKDGDLKADIDRICSTFPRLRERFGQRAGTLSGGEQQMLAIGRGLMSRPKLLMLDEPSLGLAPFLVKEIFNIIESINSQGIPVLLVEQNAHRALEIAHRGYVIETGKIVLADDAKALLKNPAVQEAYLGGA
ncbi:MAG: ABC transporter ATP-binding protein [Armatimonadetes bacterium]|nr:ABC transporter ATP-binding protein [Armatimonadota bacterium]